jgi:PAS domain S-box-containing protein
MIDEDKIRKQLIAELEKFCRRIQVKAKSEAEYEKEEKKLQEGAMKPCHQVDQFNNGIAIIQDGIIKHVNHGWAAKDGHTYEELIESPFTDYLPAHGLSGVLDIYKRYAKKGDAQSSVELEILNKEGEKEFIELNRSLIPYEGRPAELLIIHDITERKKTENKLRLLLKEKEVMMREIHHRVKNNLQIMSSLLRLQSRHFKNRKIIDMFIASQTRIRSMALIHEKLYQSENLAKIDFVRYIESLAIYLFNSYKVDMNRVRFNVKAKDVFIGINIAIPLGLIVNELVSNSLRHAFPGGKEGEICIQIHMNKKGKFLLEVMDNGVGIPNGLNIHKIKTLGMQLVIDLAKQIEGRIEVRQKEGTAIMISFCEAI